MKLAHFPRNTKKLFCVETKITHAPKGRTQGKLTQHVQRGDVEYEVNFFVDIKLGMELFVIVFEALCDCF